MDPVSKNSWLLPHMKFVEDWFFGWIPALPVQAQRWEGERRGPWQAKQRWNLCIRSQQLNTSSTGRGAGPRCLSVFCMNAGTLVSLYNARGIQQLPAVGTQPRPLPRVSPVGTVWPSRGGLNSSDSPGQSPVAVSRAGWQHGCCRGHKGALPGTSHGCPAAGSRSRRFTTTFGGAQRQQQLISWLAEPEQSHLHLMSSTNDLYRCVYPWWCHSFVMSHLVLANFIFIQWLSERQYAPFSVWLTCEPRKLTIRVGNNIYCKSFPLKVSSNKI